MKKGQRRLTYRIKFGNTLHHIQAGSGMVIAALIPAIEVARLRFGTERRDNGDIQRKNQESSRCSTIFPGWTIQPERDRVGYCLSSGGGFSLRRVNPSLNEIRRQTETYHIDSDCPVDGS